MAINYPMRDDYDMAIEHREGFLLVPHLARGMVKRMKHNRLVAYSGGFSRVYPIQVGNKTYALRCWIADIGNTKVRYQQIKRYLQEYPLPYFVDFEYVDKGILVNGQTYPITYMDWIDGSPLNKFLDQHVHHSNMVEEVADEFRGMVERLHHKRISHGDLQEGNILVQKNGSSLQLKLIDYDSLFVPTLQGWPNEIGGIPNYQHPARALAKKASEKMDYFSELVIYLSLRAYAKRPDLWKKDQEKQLLFSLDDFRRPSDSSVFRQVKALSPELRALTGKLEEFCHQKNINHLWPLEKVLLSTNPNLIYINPTSAAPPPATNRPKRTPNRRPPPQTAQTTPNPTQLGMSWQEFEGRLLSPKSAPPSSRRVQTAKDTKVFDQINISASTGSTKSTPSKSTPSKSTPSSSSSSGNSQAGGFGWVLWLIFAAIVIYFILSALANS